MIPIDLDFCRDVLSDKTNLRKVDYCRNYGDKLCKRLCWYAYEQRLSELEEKFRKNELGAYDAIERALIRQRLNK